MDKSHMKNPHRPEYPKVSNGDVLREYLKAARGYWLTIFIVTVFTIVPVIATGIFAPIFYKHLFDLISGSPTAEVVSELISTILYVLLLNGISWIAVRIYAFAMVHFQSNIMNRLRQRSFEYVIGHSYSFFNNTFSGSLVQKINRFMRSFEGVTDRLFSEIIPLLVKVAGIAIVLWYTEPIFAYAVIVWMIIFFILSSIFAKWKIPYNIISAEVESRASASLSDSLSNHATVLTFIVDFLMRQRYLMKRILLIPKHSLRNGMWRIL